MRHFWKIKLTVPVEKLWSSKVSHRYLKSRNFREDKFSRISRILSKFAKLNPREIFPNGWFAKINPREIFKICKFARFQSNHHNSHNQSFSLIPYMVYFAKINPREIFGKPQFAKINPREMQIFWTRENKSSRKYVLLRYLFKRM